MQEQQTRGKGRWWLAVGGATLLALLVWGWHLQQGPDAARFFELAARARSAGKLTEAVIQYKSGLQRAPDELPARRALGQTYLALHQPAAALTELERASGLAASQPTVQLDVAEAQLALGKLATRHLIPLRHPHQPSTGCNHQHGHHDRTQHAR